MELYVYLVALLVSIVYLILVFTLNINSLILNVVVVYTIEATMNHK